MSNVLVCQRIHRHCANLCYMSRAPKNKIKLEQFLRLYLSMLKSVNFRNESELTEIKT